MDNNIFNMVEAERPIIQRWKDADRLVEDGNFAVAINRLSELLDELEDTKSRIYHAVRLSLANAYFNADELQMSLQLADQELYSRETEYGKEDISILYVLPVLADIYIEIGELKLAAETLDRAYLLAQKYVGEDDVETVYIQAKALYVKGLCSGKMDEIICRLMKCIEQARVLAGDLNPKTAGVANICGKACEEVGLIGQALEMHRIAFNYNDCELGRTSLSALNDAENIAACYWELKDKDLALHWYDMAIRISKQLYPEGGNRAIRIMAKKANILDTLGESEKAMEIRQKIVQLTKDDCDVQLIKDETARCMVEELYRAGLAKKGPQAIKQYEKALHVLAEWLGDTASVYREMLYTNMGLECVRVCEDEKAIEFFEKALADYKTLGDYANDKDCKDLAEVLLAMYSDAGNEEKQSEMKAFLDEFE